MLTLDSRLRCRRKPSPCWSQCWSQSRLPGELRGRCCPSPKSSSCRRCCCRLCETLWTLACSFPHWCCRALPTIQHCFDRSGTPSWAARFPGLTRMAASRRSWPRRHVLMARKVEGGLGGSRAVGPVCQRRMAGWFWPAGLRTGWWRICSGGEETFREEHSWSPGDCSPHFEAPERKEKKQVLWICCFQIIKYLFLM